MCITREAQVQFMVFSVWIHVRTMPVTCASMLEPYLVHVDEECGSKVATNFRIMYSWILLRANRVDSLLSQLAKIEKLKKRWAHDAAKMITWATMNYKEMNDRLQEVLEIEDNLIEKTREQLEIADEFANEITRVSKLTTFLQLQQQDLHVINVRKFV